MPENEDLGAEKGKSGQGSKKKPPHPARAAIIQAWQARFALKYVPNFDENSGIVLLINKLVANLGQDPPVDDVVAAYKRFICLENVAVWEKLPEYYRNLRQFSQHAKNFETIAELVRKNWTDPATKGSPTPKKNHDGPYI